MLEIDHAKELSRLITIIADAQNGNEPEHGALKTDPEVIEALLNWQQIFKYTGNADEIRSMIDKVKFEEFTIEAVTFGMLQKSVTFFQKIVEFSRFRTKVVQKFIHWLHQSGLKSLDFRESMYSRSKVTASIPIKGTEKIVFSPVNRDGRLEYLQDFDQYMIMFNIFNEGFIGYLEIFLSMNNRVCIWRFTEYKCENDTHYVSENINIINSQHLNMDIAKSAGKLAAETHAINSKKRLKEWKKIDEPLEQARHHDTKIH